MLRRLGREKWGLAMLGSTRLASRLAAAGAAALVPGQGLRDIYTGKMMFSVFTNVKFQF